MEKIKIKSRAVARYNFAEWKVRMYLGAVVPDGFVLLLAILLAAGAKQTAKQTNTKVRNRE